MKRDFDYVGFEVPESTRLIMRKFLDKLQNVAPDSFIEATVTKGGQNYELKVTVKFADGRFSTEQTGHDLMEILNQTSETLRLQVRDWRESRFGVDDQDGRKTSLN